MIDINIYHSTMFSKYITNTLNSSSMIIIYIHELNLSRSYNLLSTYVESSLSRRTSIHFVIVSYSVLVSPDEYNATNECPRRLRRGGGRDPCNPY